MYNGQIGGWMDEWMNDGAGWIDDDGWMMIDRWMMNEIWNEIWLMALCSWPSVSSKMFLSTQV